MDFKNIDPEFIQEQVPGIVVCYLCDFIRTRVSKTKL